MAYPLLGITEFREPNQVYGYDLITFFADERLPLAEMPDCGVALDIDKKKSPGRDFPNFTSKGFDVVPIRIVLCLFVDTIFNANWLNAYNRVRDRLTPKLLSRRNAVPVYHPILAAEGISSIVVSKRSGLKHVGNQIFHVDIEAVDVRSVRASGGTRGGSTTKNVRQQDTSLESANTRLGQPDQATNPTPSTNQRGRP